MSNKFLKTILLTIGVCLICGIATKAAPGLNPKGKPMSAASTKKSYTKTKMTNTFETPDFNFPQTVIGNARPELERALASRSGLGEMTDANAERAFKALLEICHAETSISEDTSADECVSLIDSVAELLPPGWKSLAYTLEASFVSDVYRVDSWTYRNRSLPLADRPAQMALWDAAMFREKVESLFRKSLDCLPEGMSLKPFESILSGGNADQYLLSDFIYYKGAGILDLFDGDNGQSNRIPFSIVGSESAGSDAKASLLTEMLTDWRASLPADACAARWSLFLPCRMLGMNIPQQGMYLRELWNSLPESTARLVVLYCMGERDFCQTVRDNSKADPSLCGFYSPSAMTARLDEAIKNGFSGVETKEDREFFRDAFGNLVARWKRVSVSFAVPNCVLPAQETEFQIANTNLSRGRLLVLRIPDALITPGDRQLQGQHLSNCKTVASIPVESDDPLPFSKKQKVTIPALAPGFYCIVITRDGTTSTIISETGKKSDEFFPIMNVTDLGSFSMLTAGENTRVYIVDGSDSRPVEGAAISLISRDNPRNRNFVHTTKTNADGAFTIPDVPKNVYSLAMKAKSGESTLTRYLWNLRSGAVRNQESQTKVSILFDRAIARPGDEVRFSAIACTTDGHSISAASDREFEFRFSNASDVVVDTLKLTTDRFGRCDGTLKIPAEGMLGSWSLAAVIGDNEWRWPSASIQVEEYKNPTTRLTLDSPEIPSDSLLVISGRVETYSGMPVPSAKVSLDIETWSRWWWFQSTDGSFSTEAMTDADGNFRVELNRSGLAGTPFADSSFVIHATSVSEGGDVAQDDRHFSFGKNSVIVPEIPSAIEASADSLRFDVRVFDAVGNPEQKELRYRLTAVEGSSAKPAEGTFTSPLLELKSASLPSGTYEISFAFAGDDAKWDDATPDRKPIRFTLWRADDKSVPGVDALWVPQSKIIAGEGEPEVSVRFGSRYAGQRILCVVSDSRKVLSSRWITSDGEMTSVAVPAPADTARIFVSLVTLRDFNPVSTTVTILPASESKRLEVKVETFRDKLTSASRESWRFRFTNGPAEAAADIPALAVMTDSALDAIVPFNWSFSPRNQLSWSPAAGFDTERNGSLSDEFRSPLKLTSLTLPQSTFPTDWIYSPFASLRGYGHIQIRGTRMYKSAMMASAVTGAVEMDEAADFAAPMAMNAMVESAPEEAGNDGGGSDDSKIVYRESECPVAFFMPDLTTASDGSVTIDFEVPDFNTEWKFQLIGYNRHLDAASLQLNAVSTKPVMVQSSLPRFVRTGDRVVLTARGFNNSSDDLNLSGRIELLDPATGDIIDSRKFGGEKTAPGASRLWSLEFDVPSTLSAVIVRSLAEADGHSDGEQSLLEILPSSSPVVESTDFYLSPAEKEFSVEIPKLRDDSAVTLLYCDNPAWYCLTALPALTEDKGKTLTSLINAYYGTSIASGLLADQPALRAGLEEMTRLQSEGKNDMLTSNLERNSSLKTVSLGSTPWVNSAAAETARMGSLASLLDTVRCRETRTKLLTDIAALQNADGGMVWYPGDKESSLWCTGRTLLHFAMLSRFGYLPDTRETRNIVTGASRYYESRLLEDWNRLKKEYGDSDKTLGMMLRTMTNYLYIRSQFGKSELLPTESGEFKPLADRAIDLIARSWADMGIYDRATAATLLANEGREADAMVIVESLSQFAMSDPRKGMWFDNLDGGVFSPWNKLITTAQVLEAFTDVRPTSPDVDKLRQWLLLQRQTEDWGKTAGTAELVQAILSSGTDWMGNAPFTVKVGSKTLLDSSKMPAYGEAVITLRPKDVSDRELTVSREGRGIAWGGVVTQYVAPMAEIKPAASTDLSVEKSIFVLRAVDGIEKPQTIAEAGELKVGDKVRVLLTVDCGRDMEYVALTDERGACLEPSEVLSGVDVVAGRFLYREVRNSATDFFISYLPKGRYQFSYDCRLTAEGTFTAGIATIQSQYAPQLTAHSTAVPLTVVR